MRAAIHALGLAALGAALWLDATRPAPAPPAPVDHASAVTALAAGVGLRPAGERSDARQDRTLLFAAEGCAGPVEATLAPVGRVDAMLRAPARDDADCFAVYCGAVIGCSAQLDIAPRTILRKAMIGLGVAAETGWTEQVVLARGHAACPAFEALRVAAWPGCAK